MPISKLKIIYVMTAIFIFCLGWIGHYFYTQSPENYLLPKMVGDHTLGSDPPWYITLSEPEYHFPKPVVEYFVKALGNSDHYHRSAAAVVLNERAYGFKITFRNRDSLKDGFKLNGRYLPSEIVNALVPLINDPYNGVRLNAVKALINEDALSSDIRNALCETIQFDTWGDLNEAVQEVLQNQRDITPPIDTAYYCEPQLSGLKDTYDTTTEQRLVKDLFYTADDFKASKQLLESIISQKGIDQLIDFIQDNAVPGASVEKTWTILYTLEKQDLTNNNIKDILKILDSSSVWKPGVKAATTKLILLILKTRIT